MTIYNNAGQHLSLGNNYEWGSFCIAKNINSLCVVQYIAGLAIANNNYASPIHNTILQVFSGCGFSRECNEW